jgi:type IV fimbrial biogenesis protein FimT
MRQRGFSLIELLVTITVLALILSVAMPALGTWMDNTRIRNTAEALQNGLQKARSEAVRRNQSISFYLVSLTDPAVMDNNCAVSATGTAWVVSADSPATKCGSAPSTTVAPKIVEARTGNDAGGKVKVSGLQADGSTAADTVTFNGFGRVTDATPLARIDIKGPDDSVTYRKLRLEITAAGAVRMCDPRLSDANDPRKCTVPDAG